MIKHRRILAIAGVTNKETLRLQNTGITDLRQHDPAFANIDRKLAESVVKRVNDAYERAFTVPGARFRRTKPPHLFRTLEISEPSVNHIKFRNSGIAEIHVEGLAVLWFKTDHRMKCLERPKAIRITQHGRSLIATLVYDYPKCPPSLAKYQSRGMDLSVVQRLTVVNHQGKYRQIVGIDASRHRNTLRGLRQITERYRDAALRDGRARWVNVKRRDGKPKRRFRWNQKPSRKYPQAMARLRRVERKRIKTLQAAEHRITTEIVRTRALIAVEDTAIRNMTRSAKGSLGNPGQNVAQKRGLNRSILSQRWYSISQKLEYKSRWYGRQFIRVPAAHTSQTCPSCGHVSAGDRRTQAKFECVNCGSPANADVVSGENIRRRGDYATAGIENPAQGPAPVNAVPAWEESNVSEPYNDSCCCPRKREFSSAIFCVAHSLLGAIMLQHILDNRMPVIGGVVALSPIIFGTAMGIHRTVSARVDEWPPFTMAYEIDGSTVSVGNETYQGREVHRLEYRTETHWIDTVTVAPSVETAAGPASAVGSYRRLNRRVFREFDSFVGATSVTEIERGVNLIPGAAFSRLSIRVLVEHGYELTRKTTAAKVCFNSSCQINATGIAMNDDGWEYIWVDDARGIPLQIGISAFVVTELQIEGEKQEVSLTP